MHAGTAGLRRSLDPSAPATAMATPEHRHADHDDAPSGADGLEIVAALERRQEPLALCLVDQRMPSGSGTDFLVQAGARYPEAKRVLLTAYADTDAAIDAINTAHVDHYLLKPWHPPEEKLYPVLDDELDAERQPEALRALEAAGAGPDDLPLVPCPDGTVLRRATPASVAEKVGLRTQAEAPYDDLVIVGGGRRDRRAVPPAALRGRRRGELPCAARGHRRAVPAPRRARRRRAVSAGSGRR